MADKTFKSLFEGKEYKLEEKIDIEYGLLPLLEAYKIITNSHRKYIEVTVITVFS